MPYCKMGTHCFKVEACEECASGTCPADCMGDSGDGNKKKGICFIRTILTPALAKNILTLGVTYQSALDFRDDVLETNALGKRFVKLYYRHNPAARDLVLFNPTLLGQAIHAWLIIAPFAEAVVAAASPAGKKRANGKRPMRFTRMMHRRVVDVLETVRRDAMEAGEGKEFNKAVDEVLAELKRYVGLTPEEALQTLRRSSSRSSGVSKKRR
jgi:hypothetical protein